MKTHWLTAFNLTYSTYYYSNILIINDQTPSPYHNCLMLADRTSCNVHLPMGGEMSVTIHMLPNS